MLKVRERSRDPMEVDYLFGAGEADAAGDWGGWQPPPGLAPGLGSFV